MAQFLLLTQVWGQMFGVPEGTKHPRDQAVYISLVFFIRKVHSLLMYILITIRNCIYPEGPLDYHNHTRGSISEYFSENVVLKFNSKKSKFTHNFNFLSRVCSYHENYELDFSQS